MCSGKDTINANVIKTLNKFIKNKNITCSKIKYGSTKITPSLTNVGYEDS